MVAVARAGIACPRGHVDRASGVIIRNTGQRRRFHVGVGKQGRCVAFEAVGPCDDALQIGKAGSAFAARRFEIFGGITVPAGDIFDAALFRQADQMG